MNKNRITFSSGKYHFKIVLESFTNIKSNTYSISQDFQKGSPVIFIMNWQNLTQSDIIND